MSEPGVIRANKRPTTVDETVRMHGIGKNTFNVNWLLGHNSPSLKDAEDSTALRKRILIQNDLYKGGSISTLFNEYVRDAEIPTKAVNIKNIYSTQSSVDRDVVSSYLHSSGIDDTPIIGFKVNGTNKVILVNGNHRVAANYLLGLNKVNMKVLNAPKEYFKDMQKK